MMWCALVGVILNVTLAYALDVMLVDFARTGIFDIGFTWDTTAPLGRLITLFYVLMYVIPTFGIAFFILAAVRRQEYDKYMEYESEGGGEF